jgi:hypothetical protein
LFIAILSPAVTDREASGAAEIEERCDHHVNFAFDCKAEKGYHLPTCGAWAEDHVCSLIPLASLPDLIYEYPVTDWSIHAN